jgi:hypothetical protein
MFKARRFLGLGLIILGLLGFDAAAYFGLCNLGSLNVLDAVAGGTVGLGLVYFAAWLRRPYIESYKFEWTNRNFAKLYYLTFKLAGEDSPGFCAMQIKWRGHAVFGKWDETPNPIEKDQVNNFRIELVPQTFYQPLFFDREYSIPILADNRNYSPPAANLCKQLAIFSGWWFGWFNNAHLPQYGDDPTVGEDDELELTLIGTGLSKRWQCKVSEILKSASQQS